MPKLNLSINGIEVTVFYETMTEESARPCKFCGSSIAYVEIFTATEMVTENYTEIKQNSHLFKEAQEKLRQNPGHDSPCCDKNICCNKQLQEELAYNQAL